MFTTLLESRRQATRQYRYTIMSVTAHASAIAVGLIAATASATTTPALSPAAPITYVDIRKPSPASAGSVARRRPEVGPGAVARTAPDIVIPELPPLPELPPIDPPGRTGGWAEAGPRLPVSSGGGHEAGIPHGAGGGPADPALLAYQVERTAILRTRVEPRYPSTLRAAGIEGRVIVRFVVDTSGRPEEASIMILDSSHPQFTDAARAALGRMRFEPARVGRDKVRQLVDLPFTFALTR